MHAVLFEVLPSESGYQRYLDIAAALRPQLEKMDGFISVERFRCLTVPGWILSFSLWRDEAALVGWRRHGEHHAAQAEGRESVFADYRLRVADFNGPAPAARQHVGAWEFPSGEELEHGRIFESLTNSGKRIALLDLDAADARDWQARANAASPPACAWCGPVLRDYGMFDRAQAPQVFPSIARR